MVENNPMDNIVKKLSRHFGNRGITESVIENHLRQTGDIVDPDQHVDAILSSEPLSFIKYGIHPNPNGETDYYALPCSLIEDAFPDTDQYQSTRDELISEILEPHDLPMEYYETGLLRKFNFDDNHWTPAQDETTLVSSPSFKFMPRNKFFDLFYNDHAQHLASKGSGQTTDEQEMTPPEPQL